MSTDHRVWTSDPDDNDRVHWECSCGAAGTCPAVRAPVRSDAHIRPGESRSDNRREAMSEHGWTRHGHRCCDQATGPRPPRVARCGGPAICCECAADAAIRHSPGSGTFAAPTSPSEPAPKITELIAESSLGAALADDAVYQRGFDHGRHRAAEDVAKLIDAFDDETRDILLKAARVALNGPDDALSVSVAEATVRAKVAAEIRAAGVGLRTLRRAFDLAARIAEGKGDETP